VAHKLRTDRGDSRDRAPCGKATRLCLALCQASRRLDCDQRKARWTGRFVWQHLSRKLGVYLHYQSYLFHHLWERPLGDSRRPWRLLPV